MLEDLRGQGYDDASNMWGVLNGMTIILRYVYCDGFVGKQFFEVVNVKETSA